MAEQSDPAPKTALIFGISGQDGAYLAKLLLDKGYAVHGTSRDYEAGSFPRLHALGIADRVRLHTAVPTDFRSILRVLDEARPDEVYNLAGQTAVSLSFSQPVDAFDSIAVGTLNILECLRILGAPIRFFNAASSECFGDTDQPASEDTPFQPQSPYAVAKAAAFWAVLNYRNAYGLRAVCGILFNHESPLRPSRFVTRKITAAAARIAAGSDERLELGNIDVVRDWGWAPEYVEAMWRANTAETVRDYVIATGESHSLRELVALVFAEAGLDWQEHVTTNPALLRPSEPLVICADPSRIAADLGWRAQVRLPELARLLLRAARETER